MKRKGLEMPRMDKLSNYRTTIHSDADGWSHVVYVKTPIVSWNDGTIILNSGGWKTVTTKRKMNQASNQFALGFGVYQKARSWFVALPDGQSVPFVDGMQIQYSFV